MQKSLLVVGLAVLLFGAGVFALFVLPQIGGGTTGAARDSSNLSHGLNLLAVAVSSSYDSATSAIRDASARQYGGYWNSG